MAQFKDLFSVQGRRVIVTGGASGIGLAIGEALAERGALVTIMDRDGARLDAATKRLSDAGHKVRGQILDVTDPQSVRDGFEQAVNSHGGLDVVFANAGVGGKGGFLGRDGNPNPDGEIANYDLAAWKETLGVNLDGVFLTVKEAARHMKPKMAGHIVITASFMPLVTVPSVDYAYSVSKAACAYLTRNVALELSRYNIQVNAIAPGMFATNIAGGRLSDPDVQKRTGPSVPLGRVAETDEMKGLAVFLASSASSYITGAQMLIDGGLALGRVNYRDTPTKPPQ